MSRPLVPGRGLRRFVGFALAPNERGYCGPREHKRLVDYLRHSPDVGADDEVELLARAFDGPLPYLQLIAAAAGVGDPFAPAVVEAYWVGNPLLDAVDPDTCADALVKAFGDQPTVDARRIEATRAIATPHHSYHVLVTYPWIDVVAAGRPSALGLLDNCRVRVGTVTTVTDHQVQVSCRPWRIVDGRIVEATPEVQTVRPIERHEASAVSPGDRVAVHWDHLVDRLEPEQADQLHARTRPVVDGVNRFLLGGV